ncbi:MAG TPA: type II toxin-antitoxin system death-on-curing family toxin [Verrucomicrobia bacterium]|nr:MAG: death-on-curing protein [Lentisphaerae bacterium GWF2_57_35]HBA84483.1 type II toxin-antitoxin system death-on-curing family toxin [Verrucomicrobiota bacterium]
MKEPLWITQEVILATQEELLARFGGLAGVRDEGLLDSALNRPRHAFAYGSPSLYELAAEYALGIVKNHPFIDGNKRAGFMAAYIFLGINDIEFNAPEEEVVLQTLALAAGEMGKKAYASWLKKSCNQ